MGREHSSRKPRGLGVRVLACGVPRPRPRYGARRRLAARVGELAPRLGTFPPGAAAHVLWAFARAAARGLPEWGRLSDVARGKSGVPEESRSDPQRSASIRSDPTVWSCSEGSYAISPK